MARTLYQKRGDSPDSLRSEWEGLRRVDDATIHDAYRRARAGFKDHHAATGRPNRYVNGVYHSDLHGVPMPANMPPPAPPVLYDYLRNEHKAEEQRLKVMGGADLHIRVSGSGGAAGRVVSSSASGLIRRINIPRGSTMPTPSSDA